MSNIDKRAQKELYAKVEQQAHSLRGNPREYQVVTGLCPVNVIEMHAKKIQALLDELEAAEKKAVEMPTFDGYVPHVARELQAAFRIACDNAGINVTAAGKGEAS